MITEQIIIHPIPPGLTAIQVAASCYKKWMGMVSFEEDVAHYLAYGMVVARPDVFAMAKIIEQEGEPAWFIRMAVGPLDTLFSVLPGYLSKICFCRRNDGRLRVYSLDRFYKCAQRQMKRERK